MQPSWSFADFGRDFHLYCKARIILWILKKRYERRRVGRRSKYFYLLLIVVKCCINAKLSLKITESSHATERVDCEQSLFCSKIRGEKEAEHESRASSKAASSVTRVRLLFPRGFSSKRETARSLLSG